MKNTFFFRQRKKNGRADGMGIKNFMQKHLNTYAPKGSYFSKKNKKEDRAKNTTSSCVSIFFKKKSYQQL